MVGGKLFVCFGKTWKVSQITIVILIHFKFLRVYHIADVNKSSLIGNGQIVVFFYKDAE